MDETFSITPTSSAPLVTIAIISAVLIVLLALFAFIGFSSRNVKYEVSDSGLNIKGGLYGRFIPKEDIAGGEARIINLDSATELKASIRTNGIGLPGYAAGWFKLKNGEKALLFVTDKSSVVYIPTAQDYSVLLSVSDAEGFYESIKRWE